MALWPSEERPRPDELKALPEYRVQVAQVRPARGRSRWLWIAAGLAVVAGVVAGTRSYWLPKWVRLTGTSVTTAVASDKETVRAATPSESPSPQLVTGLRPLREPSAEPQANPAQPQPSDARPEPQYATGLPPITVPPEEPQAVAPAPATAPPIPPSPQAKPAHRRATPGQSPPPTSGQVRF